MKRRAFCVDAGTTFVAGALAHRAALAAGHTSASFALIGDTPYNVLDERQLERVLESIDDDVAFVIHVGDIMSSWERCSDETLDARAALLQSSPRPLVYTPGDNEWVDCASARGGGYDPRGRLERLRSLFFGATFRLPDAAAQVEANMHYPENRRWEMGATLFVTLNVPGSNNGEDARALRDGHNAARNAANERWLRQAFAHARAGGHDSLVIALHANPRFERDRRPAAPGGPASRAPDAASDRYLALRALLRELAAGFPGQILVAHGDTHRFRVDRPLLDAGGEPLANVQRVECFGAPFTSSWVSIRVPRSRSEPFEVSFRHLR